MWLGLAFSLSAALAQDGPMPGAQLSGFRVGLFIFPPLHPRSANVLHYLFAE
jgi:hypothetical protein